jgi:hypothetical protein
MKIWKRIVWWFRALLVPIITICIASPVGADEDTLRDLGATAAPGEIAKWDGEQWRNAHDNIGVGSIETGPGLGLQQTDSKVHLSLLYPPIGSIIAWMKNHPGVDAKLPDGWVECNGQLLSDTNSPLHETVIPNLNGVIRLTDGAIHRSGFETTPENAFDLDEATYAENVQGRRTDRHIGLTFEARFVEAVYFTFTVNNYSSMQVRLQAFDGSAWSTKNTYNSNQTGTRVPINETVQGIRLYFYHDTTSTRTCRVFRLDDDAGSRFLRGATESGTMGGSVKHRHDSQTVASGSGATVSARNRADHLPPHMNVVWIMRVR